jgi:hypothetical protein
MSAIAAEKPMAKSRKNSPVRVDDEAIKWARIASGYTGESVAEYISRVITERGKADAERLHAETMSPDSKGNES